MFIGYRVFRLAEEMLVVYRDLGHALITVALLYVSAFV